MSRTEEPRENNNNDMMAQGSKYITDAANSLTSTLNDTKDQISNSINEFSTQPNAPSEFSFSNTIVAKFAFLLLIIIVFMFCINLGINLITYATSPGSNPYLVKGMRGGRSSYVIPQDPNSSGSISLLRSNNQSYGAEFTWSIWLYINDLDAIDTKYQHIFNKGDASYHRTTGLSLVNNAPGLYLGNGGNNKNPKNTLRIIMDMVGTVDSTVNDQPGPTMSSQTTMGSRTTTRSQTNVGPQTTMGSRGINNNYNEKDTNVHIDIPNVPLKKWLHVAIRLENSILDVYINGTIDKRQRLNNVPKQNYYDVNICQNGGFDGNLSDLRYFNSALNVFQINTIVSNGPNLSTDSQFSNEMKLMDYRYLSTIWYGV
jgi:hypothetical protein